MNKSGRLPGGRKGLLRAGAVVAAARGARRDPFRGQSQMGSLTGAVHLSNDNADVPRSAQRGQKPRVEPKGKCWLDPDSQYEHGLRKHGLAILLTFTSFKREVSEKLPQG
ncbi:hypothetical protein A6K26_010165 [Gammaproteobacteria bacterium 2W06]|jgi:hypothetical protein|nr:hypothetical protein A6K26_010165 [Gammaproteobacteria bacterium 2W06]